MDALKKLMIAGMLFASLGTSVQTYTMEGDQADQTDARAASHESDQGLQNTVGVEVSAVAVSDESLPVGAVFIGGLPAYKPSASLLLVLLDDDEEIGGDQYLKGLSLEKLSVCAQDERVRDQLKFKITEAGQKDLLAVVRQALDERNFAFFEILLEAVDRNVINDFNITRDIWPNACCAGELTVLKKLMRLDLWGDCEARYNDGRTILQYFVQQKDLDNAEIIGMLLEHGVTPLSAEELDACSQESQNTYRAVLAEIEQRRQRVLTVLGGDSSKADGFLLSQLSPFVEEYAGLRCCAKKESKKSSNDESDSESKGAAERAATVFPLRDATPDEIRHSIVTTDAAGIARRADTEDVVEEMRSPRPDIEDQLLPSLNVMQGRTISQTIAWIHDELIEAGITNLDAQVTTMEILLGQRAVTNSERGRIVTPAVWEEVVDMYRDNDGVSELIAFLRKRDAMRMAANLGEAYVAASTSSSSARAQASEDSEEDEKRREDEDAVSDILSGEARRAKREAVSEDVTEEDEKASEDVSETRQSQVEIIRAARLARFGGAQKDNQ